MAGGGCGSCTFWSNPISAIYSDASTYFIGVGSGRTMGLVWIQASFPEMPCPSPLTITWEYWAGTKWTGIPSSFSSSKPLWIHSGGVNTQLATAGVTYNRVIKFRRKGLFKLRGLMSCGPSFNSGSTEQRVLYKNLFVTR